MSPRHPKVLQPLPCPRVILTMRSGGGVLRMKHLICPFWPCRACWVCVLEMMGGPVETGEAAGTPWGFGDGGVRAALDEYWGPARKGRDGETAPSPPVMENIDWRLWGLLGFCKVPTKHQGS